VARLIWMHKNSYVFRRDFISPFQLVSNARDMMDNYTQANQIQAFADRGRVPLNQHWQKPEEGLIKKQLECCT
jgi:hypothetical protein